MASIKEYATLRGVTTQSIYKVIKRYKKELHGHIITKDRKQWIDDEGVDILNKITGEQPTHLINATDDYTKRLEEENHNLLLKIAELQDRLIKKSEKIEALQEANLLLLSESKVNEVNKSVWERFFKFK